MLYTYSWLQGTCDGEAWKAQISRGEGLRTFAITTPRSPHSSLTKTPGLQRRCRRSSRRCNQLKLRFRRISSVVLESIQLPGVFLPNTITKPESSRVAMIASDTGCCPRFRPGIHPVGRTVGPQQHFIHHHPESLRLRILGWPRAHSPMVASRWSATWPSIPRSHGRCFLGPLGLLVET